MSILDTLGMSPDAPDKSLLGKFAIALCILSRREFRPDEDVQ